MKRILYSEAKKRDGQRKIYRSSNESTPMKYYRMRQKQYTEVIEDQFVEIIEQKQQQGDLEILQLEEEDKQQHDVSVLLTDQSPQDSLQLPSSQQAKDFTSKSEFLQKSLIFENPKPKWDLETTQILTALAQNRSLIDQLSKKIPLEHTPQPNHNLTNSCISDKLQNNKFKEFTELQKQLHQLHQQQNVSQVYIRSAPERFFGSQANPFLPHPSHLSTERQIEEHQQEKRISSSFIGEFKNRSLRISKSNNRNEITSSKINVSLGSQPVQLAHQHLFHSSQSSIKTSNSPPNRSAVEKSKIYLINNGQIDQSYQIQKRKTSNGNNTHGINDQSLLLSIPKPSQQIMQTDYLRQFSNSVFCMPQETDITERFNSNSNNCSNLPSRRNSRSFYVRKHSTDLGNRSVLNNSPRTQNGKVILTATIEQSVGGVQTENSTNIKVPSQFKRASTSVGNSRISSSLGNSMRMINTPIERKQSSFIQDQRPKEKSKSQAINTPQIDSIKQTVFENETHFRRQNISTHTKDNRWNNTDPKNNYSDWKQQKMQLEIIPNGRNKSIVEGLKSFEDSSSICFRQ